MPQVAIYPNLKFQFWAIQFEISNQGNLITLYNTPSGYSANFINLFIIKYMISIQKLTINYSCYYDLINLNNLDNLDMRTKNCNLQNPFLNFYLWGRRYFIPFGVTPKLIYISFTKL